MGRKKKMVKIPDRRAEADTPLQSSSSAGSWPLATFCPGRFRTCFPNTTLMAWAVASERKAKDRIRD